MTLVATDAIVLHAFDYRETSRILRLVTREHGVRSAIARGARRPKSRYGSALDLFAEGAAQLALHPTGDLHTLVSFDVLRSRSELAHDWGRFAAANALAEMVMRFARDDEHVELFDAFRKALDSLCAAEGAAIGAAGLGGAWTLVSHLGFGPVLDSCASCDAPVPREAPASFSHRAGGLLCEGCAAAAPPHATAPGGPRTRRLPPPAREALAAWIRGHPAPIGDDPEFRAHLRLLREFLEEHLADDRPLRALAVWQGVGSRE